MDENEELFVEPVETDETFIGCKDKNRHATKKHRVGGGAVNKEIVIDMKDRKIIAKVIPDSKQHTMQNFVGTYTDIDAKVYTDEASANLGLEQHRGHEVVCH